ncbi:hypothetical protein C8R45DRAFT_1086533 [Mycena sanguinolenta]|nr:hypothetical protein C8R45DRAFT_1086533 [Mycena sanguinolenta]
MALSTLPPEICGITCDELEELGGNLAPLCRTSRNFHSQTQRILYRSIDLQEGGMRAVKLWARTVTRHAHLAERIHALALPDMHLIDVSDIPKIVHALKKCVNLKELRISGADQSVPRHFGSGWMFDEYPFRLQKFDLTELTQSEPFDDVNPAPILREWFPRLEAFVLQVRNVHIFHRYDMAYTKHLEELGMEFLNACPTL